MKIRQLCNKLFPKQDPEAKKPEDWDDREKIDDPEDSKPEDWEKPEHIPDPDAQKPDDWDDEMDGEWEPPMIDNPEYKVRTPTVLLSCSMSCLIVTCEINLLLI